MEKTRDIILLPLSRKKAAQERKAERKRERDIASYQKNHEAKIAQVKERRQAIWELSKRAARTRTDVKKMERKSKAKEKRENAQTELQNKKKKIREQTKERVWKYHKKKQLKKVAQVGKTEEAALTAGVGWVPRKKLKS